MKYKKSVYKTFALITQLGLSILTPIILCVVIGVWIDNRFSIGITIPLMILGILAGGRNAFILAKHANEDQEEKEDE